MNTAARYRFRRHQHLRRPADFARVFAHRHVVRQRGMTVFAAPNQLPFSRLGLSVSRKHGSAVARHRIKRLFREAFRLNQHDIPAGLDVVLVPERDRDPKLKEFQESLRKAVHTLARRMEREEEKRVRGLEG